MNRATPSARSTRQYRDSAVDVKLVLSALWITMLFVFAYVDIFALLRADVLEAALAAIGETWAYYLIGSVVEVILLAAIARTAWTWPPPETASPLPATEVGETRTSGHPTNRLQA